MMSIDTFTTCTTKPDIESASAVVTNSPLLTELNNELAQLADQIDNEKSDAVIKDLLDQYHHAHARRNAHQVRRID